MSSKEKLTELEETGSYVFHGSSNGGIKILEPKQGSHIPDLTKPTKTIPDGSPAVSATPYADFAIFRAIINKKNIDLDFYSGFGFRNGQKEFHVSKKEVLDEARNKKGFVYVFDKKEFEPYAREGLADQNRMEWRSYGSVKPIEIVEVTGEDLPQADLIDITKER